jgi:hypothetical protein
MRARDSLAGTTPFEHVRDRRNDRHGDGVVVHSPPEPTALAPLGEEERGRIGEECAGWGMSSSTPVRTTGTGPGGHRAYAGVA